MDLCLDGHKRGGGGENCGVKMNSVNSVERTRAHCERVIMCILGARENPMNLSYTLRLRLSEMLSLSNEKSKLKTEPCP